jgi:hypothetical protein
MARPIGTLIDAENNYQYCNGKRCLTERQAGMALNGVSKCNHREHHKKVPRRKYYCRACGFFHLTSQSEKTKKIAKHDYDFD